MARHSQETNAKHRNDLELPLQVHVKSHNDRHRQDERVQVQSRARDARDIRQIDRVQTVARDDWVPRPLDGDAAEDGAEEEAGGEAKCQDDAGNDEVAHLGRSREDAVVEEEEGEFDAAGGK